ncbi:MAG: DUF378 domain-containing protein [Minisyncoccia bacterium]
MKNLSALDWVAVVLVIIGGLNWGLVGIFSFDLVATIFGVMSVISQIIYILVGLSALYLIFTVGKFARK